MGINKWYILCHPNSPFTLSFSVKGKDNNIIQLDHAHVILHYTGYVYLHTASQLETSCNINLFKFPFDTQNCTIHFAIKSFDYKHYISSSIYKKPKEQGETYNLDYFSVKKEWLDIKETFDIKYDSWAGMVLHRLVYTLQMRRNPNFFVIYLLIPSILMAFVSVLVFLLPPESGERIGLSVTVLLSYTVFLLTVSEMTPRGGSGSSVLGRTSNRTIQPFNSNS